jgi:hypothetical protein
VEIAAEGVTGLVEECAAVLGIGFGPQGGDELVAADAAGARGGEEGEERQRLSLLGRAGRGNAVDVYGEPAERLEVEHVAPFDWPLSGF